MGGHEPEFPGRVGLKVTSSSGNCNNLGPNKCVCSFKFEEGIT